MKVVTASWTTGTAIGLLALGATDPPRAGSSRAERRATGEDGAESDRQSHQPTVR